IKVAAIEPKRVSGLVAMGTHSGMATAMSPSGPSEGIRALVQAYRDPSPAGLQRLIKTMTFDPAFATEELINARSRAAREHPEHLENFLRSFEQGKFLRPPAGVVDYASIGAPTLLIHGRDDRVL